MAEINTDQNTANATAQPNDSAANMVTPKNQVVLEPQSPPAAAPNAEVPAQPATAPDPTAAASMEQPAAPSPAVEPVSQEAAPVATDTQDAQPSQAVVASSSGSKKGLIIGLLVVLGVLVGVYFALGVI